MFEIVHGSAPCLSWKRFSQQPVFCGIDRSCLLKEFTLKEPFHETCCRTTYPFPCISKISQCAPVFTTSGDHLAKRVFHKNNRNLQSSSTLWKKFQKYSGQVVPVFIFKLWHPRTQYPLHWELCSEQQFCLSPLIHYWNKKNM